MLLALFFVFELVLWIICVWEHKLDQPWRGGIIFHALSFLEQAVLVDRICVGTNESTQVYINVHRAVCLV